MSQQACAVCPTPRLQSQEPGSRRGSKKYHREEKPCEDRAMPLCPDIVCHYIPQLHLPSPFFLQQTLEPRASPSHLLPKAQNISQRTGLIKAEDQCGHEYGGLLRTPIPNSIQEQEGCHTGLGQIWGHPIGYQAPSTAGDPTATSGVYGVQPQ